MSMAGKKTAAVVTKHSILNIDLGTEISERGGNDAVDMMTLLQGEGMPSSLGLNTVISAIENAADNDKVDGI